MKKLTAPERIIGPTSLLAVGLLYGFSATIVKYLSHALDPFQIVEYRFGIAFIGAMLLALAGRKSLGLRKLDKGTLVAFAVTLPIMATFFTLSIFHTSVALTVFSFYASNLVAQFVLGGIYFGERVDEWKAWALVSTAVALVTLTDPLHHFVISPGLVFGVTAGIIQAIASLFQKRLGGTTNKVGLLVVQSLAGAILGFLFLMASGKQTFATLAGRDWLLTIVLGLITLAVMHLFLVGYKHTNLNIGSILVSSELLFAPLFAWLFLGERPTQNVVIGGVFTVIAAVLAHMPIRLSSDSTD